MKLETGSVKKRPLPGGLITIGAGLMLVVVVALVSIQMLNPNGWSKDRVFEDGRMAMRVQFKVEPDPPRVGMANLMVKVKDIAGFVMLVDHVHFSMKKSGETIAESIEGEPVGDFSITSGKDSFYTARIELPSPEIYQLVIAVEHKGSSFEAVWPLEAK